LIYLDSERLFLPVKDFFEEPVYAVAISEKADDSIGLKYAQILIVAELDGIVDLEARLGVVLSEEVRERRQSLWWERLT
jgi:hypothetical protein